jgi:hypothetical protein
MPQRDSCQFAFRTAVIADAKRKPASPHAPSQSGGGPPTGEFMRGKDFNTGLRGVLFEAQHYARMGAAVWLYGWLVLRQTHQSGSVGWVLGGAPISYREIEEETGFNRRTLERWMTTLRRHGYIETEAAPAGVVVRITKAKKFPQGSRNSAEPVRRVAEGSTQNLQKSTGNCESNQNITDGIGSSSIARSQERTETPSPHVDFHSQTKNQIQNPEENCNPKPSGLSQKQNQTQTNQRPNQPPNAQREPELSVRETYLLITRLRQQLLRCDRDEAVRRELAVGTGPEVPHS